jgi:hypothetical protein
MPKPLSQVKHQPTRTRAVICNDSHLVLEIARLEQELLTAQQGNSAADPVSELAERILALRDEAKASEEEYVFAGIGRLAYRDLIRAHAPTQDQADLVGKDYRLTYNPDTFPPALFAASCESHTGTADEWADLLAAFSEGQYTRLWEACVAAQAGVNDVPKAAHAFAATRTRAASSE